VVSVGVLHTPKNVRFELSDDDALLLRCYIVYSLEKYSSIRIAVCTMQVPNLLNDSATVHLDRERRDMAQHAVEQERPLLRHAKFEELLDYVICEEVPHQKQGMTRHDFFEYSSKFIWRSRLKLGLDEPRSMLVTGKLDDVPEDILSHSD
jgi:hypothetical protein